MKIMLSLNYTKISLIKYFLPAKNTAITGTFGNIKIISNSINNNEKRSNETYKGGKKNGRI